MGQIDLGWRFDRTKTRSKAVARGLLGGPSNGPTQTVPLGAPSRVMGYRATDMDGQTARVSPVATSRRPTRLALVLATLLLLPLGLLTRPATADPVLIPLDAIGRVLDSDNQFKCTGFIIASIHRTPPAPSARYSDTLTGWYENTLITAGHCLEYAKYFTSKDGQTHPIQTIVGFSDHTHGYDILIARFNTVAALPALEPAYHHPLNAGDSLMHIGYGRTALQINVNPFVGYSDRGDLVVDGISGPGDSGSPILLPGTRKVVGILHSGTVDVPDEGRGNPYYCLFQSCASTRPYYATPIDRIESLARW